VHVSVSDKQFSFIFILYNLQALHKYGARKFGVLGISHIGCVPFVRSQNPTGRCIEDLNGLARTFNTAAKARMHSLKAMLEGMKYSYGNVYDLMSLAIAKPHLFGKLLSQASYRNCSC